MVRNHILPTPPGNSRGNPPICRSPTSVRIWSPASWPSSRMTARTASAHATSAAEPQSGASSASSPCANRCCCIDCQRVLAIPAKRQTKRTVDFLEREEAATLLSMPDLSTSIGRRDRNLLLAALQKGFVAFAVTHESAFITTEYALQWSTEPQGVHPGYWRGVWARCVSSPAMPTPWTRATRSRRRHRIKRSGGISPGQEFVNSPEPDAARHDQRMSAIFVSQAAVQNSAHRLVRDPRVRGKLAKKSGASNGVSLCRSHSTESSRSRLPRK